MNEVTIKGEIKFVDEVREYGNNGFRKHRGSGDRRRKMGQSSSGRIYQRRN